MDCPSCGHLNREGARFCAQCAAPLIEITERDSNRTARERIAGKLVLLDKSFEEDLPLIFEFLAVPDPLRPAPWMDPEARQRQLLGLMKRLTHEGSAARAGPAAETASG